MTVGAAALVGAIVGGGLKALGVEVPVIGSTRRQIMLGVAGAVMVLAGVGLDLYKSSQPHEDSSATKVEPPVERSGETPRMDSLPPAPKVSDVATPSHTPPVPMRQIKPVILTIAKGHTDTWRDLKLKLFGVMDGPEDEGSQALIRTSTAKVAKEPIQYGLESRELGELKIEGCESITMTVMKIEVRRPKHVTEAQWLSASGNDKLGGLADGSVTVKLTGRCSD